MKSFKKYLRRQTLPALMLIALAAFAPSTAQAQSSASASKNSDTGVKPEAGSPKSERETGSPKSQVQGPKSVLSEPGTVVTGPSGVRGPTVREGINDNASNMPALTLGPRTAPDIQALINSCAAAAADLAATRILVKALERENTLLKERNLTFQRSLEVLTELNEVRKNESAALRETITAKNDTLAAKDAVIASQDRLITELKSKKSSPLKRLTDVLIGVGLMALFR